MSKFDVSTSLVKIFYQGGKIFCKSIYRSIVEEIECSQEAARMRYGDRHSTVPTKVGDEDSAVEEKFGIGVEEARKILNLTENPPSADKVETKFTQLFELNDPKKGGNLYLQSKIFRAKQRLNFEIRNRTCSKKKSVDQIQIREACPK